MPAPVPFHPLAIGVEMTRSAAPLAVTSGTVKGVAPPETRNRIRDPARPVSFITEGAVPPTVTAPLSCQVPMLEPPKVTPPFAVMVAPFSSRSPKVTSRASDTSVPPSTTSFTLGALVALPKGSWLRKRSVAPEATCISRPATCEFPSAPAAAFIPKAAPPRAAVPAPMVTLPVKVPPLLFKVRVPAPALYKPPSMALSPGTAECWSAEAMLVANPWVSICKPPLRRYRRFTLICRASAVNWTRPPLATISDCAPLPFTMERPVRSVPSTCRALLVEVP
jgi:hypothetical protein